MELHAARHSARHWGTVLCGGRGRTREEGLAAKKCSKAWGASVARLNAMLPDEAAATPRLGRCAVDAADGHEAHLGAPLDAVFGIGSRSGHGGTHRLVALANLAADEAAKHVKEAGTAREQEVLLLPPARAPPRDAAALAAAVGAGGPRALLLSPAFSAAVARTADAAAGAAADRGLRCRAEAPDGGLLEPPALLAAVVYALQVCDNVVLRGLRRSGAGKDAVLNEAVALLAAGQGTRLHVLS